MTSVQLMLLLCEMNIESDGVGILQWVVTRDLS